MKNKFLDKSWVQHLTRVVQFVGVHIEFSILFWTQNLSHRELPEIGMHHLAPAAL